MKTSVGMEKARVWISGNLGTKMATRLFRGLALGVLLAAATGLYFSINQGEAGNPLASAQSQCYWEIDASACTSDQLKASLGLVSSSSGRANYVEDPEVEGMLLGMPRRPVAASRLSSEQLQLIDDLEIMGFPWRIDHQGKVVVVEAPRKPFAGRPLSSEELARIYAGLDELTSGGPASVDTLSSIDLNEVWTEIEDTPVYHLMKQLKAGNLSSRAQTDIYLEFESLPGFK